MTEGRPRIVVLHALRPTSRQTTITHLTSFRRHLPNADVQYLHFAQPLPPDLEIPSIDVLIVNYDFLNYRFTPLWPFIRDRWRPLAERARFRVAIPQDDFWASRHLDAWCTRWKIDRVLSPIETGRERIYPRTVRTAEFETVLTGYVDESIAPGPPLVDRPIDLGQRVRRMPPHLGRYAQEKSNQAMTFAAAARTAEFTVDVSDRNEDAFLGETWFDFLRSCRYTVGMKGGASRIDPWGLEYLRVQRHLARNPEADFEEVARRSMRGLEVTEMTAISPRLLESASTGTCQVLPPGDYLGALNPWTHYLPLDRDFSNIGIILDRMRDVDGAQAIAAAARTALVESGSFTDRALVEAAMNGQQMGRVVFNDDSDWTAFVDALSFSAEVWNHDGAAAHDAVQEAVRWFVDTNQDPASIGGLRRSSGSSTSVGLEIVMRYIELTDRRSWFRTIVEWSQNDRNVRRSPWSWRPV